MRVVENARRMLSQVIDLERHLRHRLVEYLALDGRNLEFKRGRLPGTVARGKGTRSPWGSTMYFGKVRQLRKGVLIPERHKDDTVVRQSGDRVRDRRLLSASRRCSANEDARVLAVQSTLGP